MNKDEDGRRWESVLRNSWLINWREFSTVLSRVPPPDEEANTDKTCAQCHPETEEAFLPLPLLPHLFFLSPIVTLSMAFASSDFIFIGSLSNTRSRSLKRGNSEYS